MIRQQGAGCLGTGMDFSSDCSRSSGDPLFAETPASNACGPEFVTRTMHACVQFRAGCCAYRATTGDSEPT